MNVPNRRAGFYLCKGFLLRIENNLIDLALARSELSVYGIGARDVSCVPAIFGPDVDNDKIPVLHLSRAGIVVKNRGIWPRSDDRRKRRPFGSAPPEFVFDRGFDFIL